MHQAIFLPAAVLVFQAASFAQMQPRGMLFQEADSVAVGRGAGVTVIPLPRTEKGKPFSATATTQIDRTFLDGTHVSQTTTTLEYRDAEGRVRTETRARGASSSEPARNITIRDPVAGVTYKLDPARKIVTKLPTTPTPEGAIATGREGNGGRGRTSDANHQSPPDSRTQQAPEHPNQRSQAPNNKQTDIVEDLGVAILSGISAHGTRVTAVVPVGAIGNDREFRSVSERWFSADLNLLVKSVNADPRFGTTTFVLSNIRPLPPDAALFQIPIEYKLVSGGVQ